MATVGVKGLNARPPAIEMRPTVRRRVDDSPKIASLCDETLQISALPVSGCTVARSSFIHQPTRVAVTKSRA